MGFGEKKKKATDRATEKQREAERERERKREKTNRDRDRDSGGDRETCTIGERRNAFDLYFPVGQEKINKTKECQDL